MAPPSSGGRHASSTGPLARIILLARCGVQQVVESALASVPAETANGAGRGRRGVVPDCALGIGQDRCEWHAGGMGGEDDLGPRRAVGSALIVKLEPSSVTTASLPRARRSSRQVEHQGVFLGWQYPEGSGVGALGLGVLGVHSCTFDWRHSL